jgi:hypothetical protein
MSRNFDSYIRSCRRLAGNHLPIPLQSIIASYYPCESTSTLRETMKANGMLSFLISLSLICLQVLAIQTSQIRTFNSP